MNSRAKSTLVNVVAAIIGIGVLWLACRYAGSDRALRESAHAAAQPVNIPGRATGPKPSKTVIGQPASDVYEDAVLEADGL